MLNKVQLIGRLGKDPEIRNLETGNSVANFTLATSEKFKDKSGQTKENTTWHNIVTWNATANVAAKYLHKGDLIYVEGKITNRSWEKDGITRYITEIVVFNLVMLGGKRSEGGGGDNSARERVDNEYQNRGNEPEYKPSGDSTSTDDLPF